MTAQVLGSNDNMLKVHRRLRIPVEGVLARHVRRADGTEVDVQLYGIHRDEWSDVRGRALELGDVLLGCGFRFGGGGHRV